jgi:ABC-type multidrug transport system fused ATPase/permease subunit
MTLYTGVSPRQNDMAEKIWDLFTLRDQASFNGAKTFRVMQDAFQWTLERHAEQVSESFYQFADQSVCIHIVGHKLAKHLVLPFSHLHIHGPAPHIPQLTIDLWDENETGICCRTNARENVSQWTEVGATSADGRFVGHQLPNTMTCLDRHTQHLIGSIAWGETVFLYERGKPLTMPLTTWYSDRNTPVIHASLVSRDGQGVLFAGWSGSGKSTSSLACPHDGFDYLGEDFVGLQKLPDGFFVEYSLSKFISASADV